MTNPTINSIFDQLDRDRHLAGYRLEERASPFFRQFLPDVLEKHLHIPINPLIIPEFPFLKEDDTNRSPKVDFFALSDEQDRAFFIELKTDLGSLDPKQTKNLAAVSKKSMVKILSDVRSIACAPKGLRERQKYSHLLRALKDLPLDAIGDTKPKIIYILPRPPKVKSSNISCIEKFAEIIYFKEFASVAKKLGPLGERFAKSLTRWIEPAGSQPPGANCP